MITNLGIDKIRFIVRLEDVNTKTLKEDNHPHAQIYRAVREHIKDCKQDFVHGATNWEHKKYSMMHSALPLAGGSKLYVSLGWNAKAKRNVVIVEFNPSKWTAKASSELLGTFACLFNWGYDEFIQRAECSYIEIPLDVIGARKSDYTFIDTRLRTFDDSFEGNGTLYLGSRTSNRYITIYDKAKEITDKGGSACQGDWLRIEPHLRPHLPVLKLGAIASAFDTLRVIDREKLAAIATGISAKAFRRRVLEDGLPPQQAYLISPNKKELLVQLELARPDWYAPKSIWKAFPSAASRITEAGLQAIAASPHLAQVA